MDTATRAIIAAIERLDYKARIFRLNDTVEMHAIPIRKRKQPQIVRYNDGDGPDEEYRAACLLAAAVGIDLMDG